MLELSGVSASYGSVPAITGVTISIGEGCESIDRATRSSGSFRIS